MFDAVSIITVIILIPLVGVSVWAYVSGALSFQDYVAFWREPVALLLGFWLRGVKSE